VGGLRHAQSRREGLTAMAHQVIALHSISRDDRLDPREGAVDTLVARQDPAGPPDALP